jgi:hypothetical protein
MSFTARVLYLISVGNSPKPSVSSHFRDFVLPDGHTYHFRSDHLWYPYAYVGSNCKQLHFILYLHLFACIIIVEA